MCIIITKKEKKRKERKVSRTRHTPRKNNNIIINRGFVLGRHGKSRKNLHA